MDPPFEQTLITYIQGLFCAQYPRIAFNITVGRTFEAFISRINED